QVAVGVELAALVVEAVRHLVADRAAAGRAEVDGGVEGGAEERRLELAGGQGDLVERGIVVGVDGGRRHAPVEAVDGLADLGELAGELEAAGGADVAGEVGAPELEVVLAPPVGEADQ